MNTGSRSGFLPRTALCLALAVILALALCQVASSPKLNLQKKFFFCYYFLCYYRYQNWHKIKCHPTTEYCKPTDLVRSCAPQFFCCTLTGITTTMKNQEYTQQEYFPVHVLYPCIVPWLWPAERINYTTSVALSTDWLSNFYCHLVLFQLSLISLIVH